MRVIYLNVIINLDNFIFSFHSTKALRYYFLVLEFIFFLESFIPLPLKTIALHENGYIIQLEKEGFERTPYDQNIDHEHVVGVSLEHDYSNIKRIFYIIYGPSISSTSLY